MEYGLAEAAKMARVNKSTLFRAIKNGKVSARRLEDGSYRVDASELARVYDLQHLSRNDDDALQRGATEPEKPATAAAGAPPVEAELAVLRAKVEAFGLERELRDREREGLQGVVEDLRRRLDKAEERILALAAPQRPLGSPTEPVAAVEPTSPRKGFLSRLLGR